MNIIEGKEPWKEIAGEPTTLSIQAYIFDIEKAPELMKDLEVLAQKYTVLVEVLATYRSCKSRKGKSKWWTWCAWYQSKWL